MAEMFTQIRREGDRSKPLLLLDDLRPPRFHFPEFLNIFISFSCSKCFKGMLQHFGKFADCHNSHNNCINYVTSWHLKQCIHQTGFCLRRRKESCKEIIITTNHTLHCDQTSYSLQQRYCFDDSTKHVLLKSLSPSGISVSSYSIIISLHFDCAGHSLHKCCGVVWLPTGSCDLRDYRNGWICHHVELSLQRLHSSLAFHMAAEYTNERTRWSTLKVDYTFVMNPVQLCVVTWQI